jgi:hypothetical protein
MEENNLNLDKIEVIKKDAVIQIKFREDFYQRLVLVFKSTFEGKTVEQLQDAEKQIQEKLVKEEWILNYETMAYFIKACEDYVKANNLTELVDKDTYLSQNL